MTTAMSTHLGTTTFPTFDVAGDIGGWIFLLYIPCKKQMFVLKIWILYCGRGNRDKKKKIMWVNVLCVCENFLNLLAEKLHSIA
jgi:hypothetical protein